MMSKGLAKLESFSSDVKILIDERGMECIDAVVHWCEENNIEVEYAAELIQKDPVMLVSIQTEAENLNYLKKTARLPV